ncbi:MAG: serine/threonine-protein kinase [Gemmataceae bacterium]
MNSPPIRRPVMKAAWIEREAFIEAFESAYMVDSNADFGRFLPPTDHPLYLPVLEELVRIDLEHHWLRGEPRWLEDYIQRFPELIEASAAVRTLAFEEFRLRRKSGHAPNADEYLIRFGIDPSRAIRDDLPESPLPGPRTPKPMAERFAHVMATLPRVGDVFLGYELVAELGSGAFGQVFLAGTKGTRGRKVALKVAQDCGGEAAVLNRLNHPHVMPVEAVHRTGPFRAVRMPYHGAVTLAHVLERLAECGERPTTGRPYIDVARPGLPTGPNVSRGAAVRDALSRATFSEASLWVIARLADALSHAHAQGVLHRDLKPANILLADDGRPMLLDFSLAADVQSNALPGGTLPYMAPEQLESFHDGRCSLDPQGDLYALGVILFQLLAGRLPFPSREPTADGIAAAIRDRRFSPANVRLLNASVSTCAAEVVGRLLDRDPARRYESALALRRELDARLPGLPSVVGPSRWSEKMLRWIGLWR